MEIEKPELVLRFEALQLEPAEFNHAAHLKVATYYVVALGPAEALVQMRSGLARLLTFGKTSGYKEDVTRFWVERIATIVSAHSGQDFESLLVLVQSQLRDSKLFALESQQRSNIMDARYPTGKFEWRGSLTAEERKRALEELAALPAKMRAAVAHLHDTHLGTHYREGGWTIRQVVHHVADSHMNAYIRFKFALTEDAPTIKPYEEARWAELKDSSLPVEISLKLLESLHTRWIVLMQGFSEADWQRSYVHPEMGPVTLERALGLYAWHGKHHLAHIQNTRLSREHSA